MNTLQGECRSTRFGTLSFTRHHDPRVPRLPSTIVSAPTSAATSQMRSAGSPRSMRVTVEHPGETPREIREVAMRVGRSVGIDGGSNVAVGSHEQHEQLRASVAREPRRVVDREVRCGA